MIFCVLFRNYSLTPITSSTPVPTLDVASADGNCNDDARVKSAAQDETTKNTRKKRRSSRKSEKETAGEDIRTEHVDKGTRERLCSTQITFHVKA